MSSKRNSRHQKHPPPRTPLQAIKSRTMQPSRPVGLQSGELGVILDPKNPTRVHSYMLADGTQIRLNNDTVPSNVPPIEPSLVVTSRGNRGERNTLAYRFGEIMTIAENLFGQRNTSYLFLGFEFVPGHARVRYVTDKSLVIQLSFQAMHNPMEAYAELAHECIHLLSPHPCIPVKILEEGMATVFSFMYMRDTMKAPILTTQQEHYDEAARLVAMLMQIDPYGIKKIREEEPDTRNITKELIQKYYPTIPEEVAARLVRTFLTGLQEEDVPAGIDWYNRESFDSDLPPKTEAGRAG